jgi:formate dehydrogenase subunit delta
LLDSPASAPQNRAAMNIDYLVKMINDISDFYVGQGDLKTAAAGVESHVSRYWEKRMRLQMLEHFRKGGAGLSEVSRAAVAILKVEGDQAPVIHARDGGPEGGGDAG